jgi:hypothetical protein
MHMLRMLKARNHSYHLDQRLVPSDLRSFYAHSLSTLLSQARATRTSSESCRFEDWNVSLDIDILSSNPIDKMSFLRFLACLWKTDELYDHLC